MGNYICKCKFCDNQVSNKKPIKNYYINNKKKFYKKYRTSPGPPIYYEL